jgi:uncharacterized caspase-like protein
MPPARLARWCRAAAAALGLLVLLVQAAHAQPGPARRVALVIGNGAYENAPALPNPANDARAMAGMLRRVGFEVLEGVDLDREAMEELLARFEERAREAEAALAFFAGHGVQVDGRNYLLPIDARLEQKADLRRQIQADWLVEDAGRAKRLALVILDACRDNPLARSLQASGRGLGVGRGLAQIQDQPPNTLVAYATAADATAADGEGANSPFTAALLEHLPTPGLEIGLALRRVRDAVIARTGGEQQPFTYGSLGGEEFYLAPLPPAAGAGPAGAGLAAPPPTVEAPRREDAEVAFWRSVEGSRDAGDLEAYLRRFPDGVFAGLARNRLKALRAAAVPPAPALAPGAPGSVAGRCGGILQKAQLGEGLSDDERAYLRTSCR